MLDEYKQNIALVNIIQNEIDSTAHKILIDAEFEAESLKAHTISDMPVHFCVQDKLLDIALRAKKNIVNSEHLLRDIKTKILIVDNLIATLTEEQLTIITLVFFDKRTIERATKLYNAKYDRYHIPRHIHRKKEEIIDKMNKILQKKETQ